MISTHASFSAWPSTSDGETMDKRVTQLWDKAEAAIDRNDTDQAEEYRILANTIAYQRRKEARELNRTLEVTHDDG